MRDLCARQGQIRSIEVSRNGKSRNGELPRKDLVQAIEVKKRPASLLALSITLISAYRDGIQIDIVLLYFVRRVLSVHRVEKSYCHKINNRC